MTLPALTTAPDPRIDPATRPNLTTPPISHSTTPPIPTTVPSLTIAPQSPHAIEKLGLDIHLLLLEYCSFETLCMLRATSTSWKRRIDIFVSGRWNIELAKFFQSPSGFRNMLDYSKSIVSGSLILYIILQATDLRKWTPNDMDIYCPIYALSYVLQYLCDREGYRVHSCEHDLSALPIRDYIGGIAFVAKLFHPTSGKNIDLVCSTRSSAVYPLIFFWGTPVMNFFTGHSLCVAYPLWTLHGLGCLRPRTEWDRRIRTCALKYASRGYYLTDFATAPWVHIPHGNPPTYCPHSARQFGDSGCMQFCFSHRSHATEPRPTCNAQWTTGGDRCPRCSACSPSSITIFYNPPYNSGLVTTTIATIDG